MTLILRDKFPSLNQISGGWKRHNWRKRFEKQLPPLIKSKRAKGPRRLVIVRVLGPRERRYDLDNLTGGAKPLIDAKFADTTKGLQQSALLLLDRLIDVGDEKLAA